MASQTGNPSGIEFGFVTPQHWRRWEELVELWHFAEETGWDSVWLMDHFFSMTGDETGPCFELWTSLAALAVHCPRLRLGSFVSSATHRNPAVLAKQAITVDHLSGGRLILGIGAGWVAREHAAHGLDFPPPRERVDRAGETLEILRLLETNERSDFSGRYYRLENAPFMPKPVKGHIPILIGSKGRRMLRHVARYADYWEGGTTPEEIAQLRAVVASECRAIERDPSDIRLLLEAVGTIYGDPFQSEENFRRHVETYWQAGIRTFLFNVGTGPLTPTIRGISEQVIPQLREEYERR
jgi:alkanesulfonate monooxygenase SsuD/methylene tetrahydromethanopterin reductase-like flavin-dependent oxidoreductase (luciferase family)